MRRLIIFICWFFVPTILFGDTPYVFDVDQSDLSLSYLATLLGPINDKTMSMVPMNSISVLNYYFITYALNGAMLIAAFVMTKGVFVGASDGDFLGENKSSLGNLTKSGLAIASLIPQSVNGYCAIQKVFFWVLLNGVGLANQLWNEVVDNYKMGNTLTTQASVSPSVSRISKDMLYIAAGLAFLDTKDPTATYYALLPNGNGLSYVCKDKEMNCNTDEDKVFDFSVYNTSKTDPDVNATPQELKEALWNYALSLKNHAIVQYGLIEDFFYGSDYTNSNALEKQIEDFFSSDVCATMLNDIDQDLSDIISQYAVPSEDLQNTLDEMSSTGWIGASFYYWDLTKSPDDGVNPANVINLLAPSSVEGQPISITTNYMVNTDYKSTYGPSILNYINLYYNIRDTNPDGDSTLSNLLSASNSSGMSALFEVNGGNFLIASLIPDDMDYYNLDYDFSKDRFYDFVMQNYKIITNLITYMQTILILLLPWTLVVGTGSGVSPLTYVLMSFVLGLFMIVLPFMMMLLSTAIMGSIFASLIPGAIFGAGVITWFFKVIETVVALPIVAMYLMVPADDHTSQLSKAFTNLVGITLRPALMVLGFSIASKICQISIMFIGGAYSYLIDSLSSLTNAGGVLYLIIMYEFTTTMTISIITRSFNIINMLPDQVFMMMGHQAGDSEGQELPSQFEQAAQQSSQAFMQMTTILTGFGNGLTTIAKKIRLEGSK